MTKILKIAVTGGPSGGKTTLIEVLQKELSGQVSVVPEAASILYRGGFPRKPSNLGRIHAQRAICATQRELEELIVSESSTGIVVCDRGSLDSIAYWPGTAEDFFKSVGTTRALELARYQWVLHLDTASRSSFDVSNPIRTESHNEAMVLNQKIREAWAGHPQRIVIAHEDHFLVKILRAKKVIEKIIAGESFQNVEKSLFEKLTHE